MTEQSPEQPMEAPDTEHLDEGPSLDPDGQVRTGNVTVDAVLASLEGLEDRPISEHVEVFEHAHEQLRRALDGAGDEATPAER
ncbi:MAG: hypothetical protein ABWX84_10805 [Nocardioides sp.]